jgi:hypothetical protein
MLNQIFLVKLILLKMSRLEKLLSKIFQIPVRKPRNRSRNIGNVVKSKLKYFTLYCKLVIGFVNCVTTDVNFALQI